MSVMDSVLAGIDRAEGGASGSAAARRRGPFGFAAAEDGGVHVGAGVHSGEVRPGWHGDALAGEGRAGHWYDGAGGDTYGLQAEANLARFRWNHDDQNSFQGTTVGLSGGLTSNDATLGFGGGLSLLDVAGGVGDQEENARVGFSFGPSAGGRVHHGDADGDGIRELGIGADIGYFSFDVRSETLGRAHDAVFGDNVVDTVRNNPQLRQLERQRDAEDGREGMSRINRILGLEPEYDMTPSYDTPADQYAD
jgi:hypothetical protein